MATVDKKKKRDKKKRKVEEIEEVEEEVYVETVVEMPNTPEVITRDKHAMQADDMRERQERRKSGSDALERHLAKSGGFSKGGKAKSSSKSGLSKSTKVNGLGKKSKLRSSISSKNQSGAQSQASSLAVEAVSMRTPEGIRKARGLPAGPAGRAIPTRKTPTRVYSAVLPRTTATEEFDVKKPVKADRRRPSLENSDRPVQDGRCSPATEESTSLGGLKTAVAAMRSQIEEQRCHTKHGLENKTLEELIMLHIGLCVEVERLEASVAERRKATS